MKKFIYLLIVTVFASCSVFAAASGSKEPDFNLIKRGTTKKVVEQELGLPLDEKAGLTKNYMYKIGDKPAIGRALGYLVLDIFTLCLWEYIGFPLEISNSGNAYKAIVKYDRNEKVLSYQKGLKP